MLRVTSVRSSSHAEKYYSRADYYLDDGHVPAHWHGRAAEMLGLQGELTFDQFSALCRNRYPNTGERLTGADRQNRRPAYDFTFSVPKSVSVLYAIAGDDRLLEAMRESVQETMRLVEDVADVRVRKGGQDTNRRSANIVYADFVHTLSRPAGPQGIPDPFLHVHAVVLNCSFDPVEKQWKALQIGDNIKKAAPYFQAIYRAKLAEKIQRLGYQVSAQRGDFEIVGISKQVNDKFSQRTKEIEAFAKRKAREEKLDQLPPRLKALVGLMTRQSKNKGFSWNQLKDHWHSMLTREEIHAIHSTFERARSTMPNFQDRSDELFQLALDHLLERQSVVTCQDLIAETLRFGLGQVTYQGTAAALEGRADLLRATYDGTPVVTTQQVMNEERELLDLIERGRGRGLPLGDVPDELMGHLNDGQRAAVQFIHSSQDRYSLVLGAAGVGKSTLLKAAIDAVERKGVQVTVLAPTSAASRGTLRADGIASAETLQKFLFDQELYQRAAGQLVFVDEISLASVQDVLKLARLAEKHNFRVCALGDGRQIKSVARGNVLNLLQKHAGVPAVHVNKILRQDGVYRAIVELLAAGRAQPALDLLEKGKKIRLAGHDALAEDYVQSMRNGEAPLIVAPTHVERAAVHAALRPKLKDAGLLGVDDQPLTRLVDRQLTEAERRTLDVYIPGQFAVFQRQRGPFQAGGRVTVTEENKELLATFASSHQLFEEMPLPLAVDEQIRITRGGRTVDGRRLYSGSTFRVRGFDGQGNIMLHDGRVLSKGFQFIDYDWSVTTFASQSRTTKRLYVAASSMSFPALNTGNFYVAVSRGRQLDRMAIFTDDPAGLKQAVQRPDIKRTAHDHLDRPTAPPSLKERTRRILEQASQKMSQFARHESSEPIRHERSSNRSPSR